MGRNVVFVLLLAREKRKEVAADTGLSYASNSSGTYLSQSAVHMDIVALTDGRTHKLDGIGVPLLLLGGVKGELREDVRREQSLEVWLQQSPCGLGLDAVAYKYRYGCAVATRFTYHSVKNVKIRYWHFFESHAWPDTKNSTC